MEAVLRYFRVINQFQLYRQHVTHHVSSFPSAKISLMQESKEPIEFTETSQPDDQLDVQEEVRTLEMNVSLTYAILLALFLCL